MSLGADLRTWLLAQGGISALVGTRVHQNRAPEGYDGPYIYFRRRSVTHEDTVDMPAGDAAFEQSFDVEAIAEDQDQAMDLGELLLALHAYRGSFGGGTVQGVFVEDQSDDYVPRGLMGDTALEFAALDFNIIGYTP